MQHAPDEDPEAVAAELRALGWQVYVMPPHIVDRATFFAAVQETLPLDPPVLSDHVWDALADSLWEGLHVSAGGRIAVIWPRSACMAEAAPADFEIARDMLIDIAGSLIDAKTSAGQPKALMVVLA